MTGKTLRCQKCQGEMFQGFVVEGMREGVLWSIWVIGQPTSDFLVRLKLSNPKTPIRTFRCQTCGYLESHAREEFAEK